MQYPRILNNNIYHSNKREPLPFFIWIPILVHSVDKTHFLVVAVELIWLLFLNFFFFFSAFFQNQTNLLGSQDSEEAM